MGFSKHKRDHIVPSIITARFISGNSKVSAKCNIKRTLTPILSFEVKVASLPIAHAIIMRIIHPNPRVYPIRDNNWDTLSHATECFEQNNF